MMTEEPKDIFESIDRLTELNLKHNTLLKELKRALRIAELLGIPAKDLKGKVGFRVLRYGDSMFRPWKEMAVRVTLDGKETIVPLLDVHHDLWPEDTLAAYHRWKRQNDKFLKGARNATKPTE